MPTGTAFFPPLLLTGIVVELDAVDALVVVKGVAVVIRDEIMEVVVALLGIKSSSPRAHFPETGFDAGAQLSVELPNANSYAQAGLYQPSTFPVQTAVFSPPRQE